MITKRVFHLFAPLDFSMHTIHYIMVYGTTVAKDNSILHLSILILADIFQTMHIIQLLLPKYQTIFWCFYMFEHISKEAC